MVLAINYKMLRGKDCVQAYGRFCVLQIETFCRLRRSTSGRTALSSSGALYTQQLLPQSVWTTASVRLTLPRKEDTQ